MAMCKEEEEVIFSSCNLSKAVEKSGQIKIHTEKRMSCSFLLFVLVGFFCFCVLTLPPLRDNVMQSFFHM